MSCGMIGMMKKDMEAYQRGSQGTSSESNRDDAKTGSCRGWEGPMCLEADEHSAAFTMRVRESCTLSMRRKVYLCK